MGKFREAALDEMKEKLRENNLLNEAVEFITAHEMSKLKINNNILAIDPRFLQPLY